MKPLTNILSLLLIAYSSQTTFILTNCEAENDSTTKTTAKITCASRGDLTGISFVNNYLKIAGNEASNKTDKTASLGSCTNTCMDNSGYTYVITCTK